MPYWLASARSAQAEGFLTRFDPRFWTVNFPRPAMAAVTTIAADALRVDAVFAQAGDLVGLIWEAADRFDHPLLAYETARDFRGCRLSFRWRSGGLIALDAANGPTLTIEGRDEGGAAFTAYVRLWNYAVGGGEDAAITLDFAALAGGFAPGGAAVWAGDIDRLFVSLAPPGYVGGSEAALPGEGAAEGWAELSAMRCEGPGAVLAIGEVVVPEHGLNIATGYDDQYNLTPARLLRNVMQLGYRGTINHYVGMSHYPRLAGGRATLSGGAINAACAAWHRDFAERAQARGYEVIWSLSYELFDQLCPEDWKQRSADGAPALTGWVPPSTLLSPACDGAMAYLRAVAAAFLGIAVAAGLTPRFQIGEPWWWVTADGRPCLYDPHAVAAFAPVAVASVRPSSNSGVLGPAESATLDRAGACLAASTAALCAAVRSAAPGCVTHLLAYLPSVLDPAAPEVRRANLPLGWAAPAFDVLQLEDYDWAARGDTVATREGVAAAGARLGYPAARQHYLAGFVLQASDANQWGAILAAAQGARARGVTTFVWALPQVLRDGLVWWDGDETMDAFDDVLFPLALGAHAEVTPGFSTAIVAGAGGAEQRQANWAEARTSYDVGPGVRSDGDMAVLLAFFRARLGPARAFRLRDPFDSAATDELLGVGDGAGRRFALVKRYGEMARRITRPVAGSVAVSVGGVATTRFSVVAGGWVELDAAPGAGVAVRAGFQFDVPVRFAEDRLSVARATFGAGEAASVPLVEVREG